MLPRVKPQVFAALVLSANFFVGVRSRQILFSHCSKPNELIFNAVLYDSVCLKVPHGLFPNATTWKIVTSEV